MVVVAHPDDETIWMGGTLLKNRNRWNTTIISLCRRNDKDRAPKFRKACKIFKAKFFISDLEDENLNKITLNEIIERVKGYSSKNYSCIFTHGENGEYGHKRHIDVHEAIKKMLNKKLLSAEKIFFFSYFKKGRLCCANKNSDKFIKLSSSLLKQKKKIINSVYGFAKNSFENLCTSDTEAFNIGNGK